VGIDLNNGFRELKAHLGHRIVIVRYGTLDDIWNIAIECESCNEVLIDFDNPKISLEPDEDNTEWGKERKAVLESFEDRVIDWDDDLPDEFDYEFGDVEE